MKHRVKMDVITEKKGFFGTRKVVEQKTVTVNGADWRRIKRAKQQADKRRQKTPSAEEQCLAALYILAVEEMADRFGE